MVKSRTLFPESIYARLELERWLEEECQASKIHRTRIWKVLPCSEPFEAAQVKDIPRKVREKLHSKFTLTTTKVLEEKHSSQGSKLVLETQDGHMIETVLIHHRKKEQAGRTTVCVSSQVGCQMACTFCATGTMGKIANLTAAEICEQVHHAKVRYPDTKAWNVVFMGMGEPLDNYQNVKEAIFSFNDPHAFNIPLRRITLSTVGVTHAIHKLAKECPQVQLALSLHAPTTEIRQQIVPTTKGYSLEKILQAIDVYQNNNTKSVMMEYIMIDNINASEDCAHALGRLLQGRNCMVNLIPYNPTEAGDRYDYQSPSKESLITFQNIVMDHYKGHDGKPIRCTVRWSSAKGQDIDAACGQLALKNVDNNNNNKSGGNDMEDIGKRNKNKGGKYPRTNGKNNNKKTTKTEQDSNDSSSWSLVGGGMAVVVMGGLLLTTLLWRRNKR